MGTEDYRAARALKDPDVMIALVTVAGVCNIPAKVLATFISGRLRHPRLDDGRYSMRESITTLPVHPGSRDRGRPGDGGATDARPGARREPGPGGWRWRWGGGGRHGRGLPRPGRAAAAERPERGRQRRAPGPGRRLQRSGRPRTRQPRPRGRARRAEDRAGRAGGVSGGGFAPGPERDRGGRRPRGPGGPDSTCLPRHGSYGGATGRSAGTAPGPRPASPRPSGQEPGRSGGSAPPVRSPPPPVLGPAAREAPARLWRALAVWRVFCFSGGSNGSGGGGTALGRPGEAERGAPSQTVRGRARPKHGPPQAPADPGQGGGKRPTARRNRRPRRYWLRPIRRDNSRRPSGDLVLRQAEACSPWSSWCWRVGDWLIGQG